MTAEDDNQPEVGSRGLTADLDSSQPVYATPEEGFDLLRAFTRIRNPAIRAALIEFASQLASAGSN